MINRFPTKQKREFGAKKEEGRTENEIYSGVCK